MDYKLLGKRIRMERRSKGLSQEKLAKIVDCSSAHISHLENAATKMSLSCFVDIVQALQTSSDKLLFGSAYQTQAVLTDEVAKVFSDADPDTHYRITSETLNTSETGNRREE